MLHVRITNDYWMQVRLVEPFISQAPEKLRFQKSRKPQSTGVIQQISRILRPTPEGGAVSARRIATPTLPRVLIFTGHPSIRPDSCHKLMKRGFGLLEGSIFPG